MRPERIARALGAAALIGALASAGGADPGLAPLEDRVQWVALERDLIAIDSAGGGEHRAPLGIGERVSASWVDGEIGVALTNRRLIAVTANTGGVHEVRFHAGERTIAGPTLGDRVALVVTTRRALGFDGGSGNWLEASLGPRERLLATAVANHVAALATDRRALALSPLRGGFFEAPLTLADAPLSLSASGDLVTLRSHTRLLVFRASGARWSERSLGLGH
ncbi:MAG TPA: hypothetical protein VII78_10285 [Myxococcota bacterium]|jgi:hypothetical protein